MRSALVLLAATTPAHAAGGTTQLAIPVLLILALVILPLANRHQRRRR